MKKTAGYVLVAALAYLAVFWTANAQMSAVPADSYVRVVSSLPAAGRHPGEICVLVGDGTAPILYMWNNSDDSWDTVGLTVGTENTVPVFGAADLEDSLLLSVGAPAAGGSGAMAELEGTFLAMDGTDTVSMFELDPTNADHTGSTNFLYGMNVGAITGDAQATEAAIYIAAGWDRDILGASDLDVEVGNGQNLEIYGPSSDLIFGVYHNSTRGIAVDAQINTTADLALFDVSSVGAMDGSDDSDIIAIDGITDGAHSGTANFLNAIDVGAITSPDADALHVGIRMGVGWDGLATLQCEYTAWPSNIEPASKSGTFWCREGIAATQDCALMFRDAGGTDTVVASITTNAVCP